MRINKSYLIITTALISIAGYYYFTRIPSLTVEEKHVTDKLFSITKRQCVGRYIFNVPDDLVNSNRDSVSISDIDISSKRMYRPAFEQRIRLREQELHGEYTVNPKDQPFLKQTYRISDNAVIFEHNENESVSDAMRILEGHIYVNGVAFLLTTKITDLSDAKYSKDRMDFLNSGISESELNTSQKKFSEMQDLFTRLSGREDDNIPTQPGVCIPEGFILDNGRKQDEKVSFYYADKGFNIYFIYDNTLKKGKSLLERNDEIQPALLLSGVRTLRKGKRDNRGMEAEEWLVKGHQQIYQPVETETDLYQFTLYANEKVANYRNPVISAEMNNGRIVSTPYSEAQLIDIWDRIIGTLELRHGAF